MQFEAGRFITLTGASITNAERMRRDERVHRCWTFDQHTHSSSVRLTGSYLVKVVQVFRQWFKNEKHFNL